MSNEATINARMPDALKRGGGRVLDENGMSPTQIIRRLYGYMEREGRIPECLEDDAADERSVFDRRRELARSVAGTITLPDGLDARKLRAERLDRKYGDLL